ncbi:MAG: NPCBM/NEW2 domain-containing protein [Planctomycetota bacterium]
MTALLPLAALALAQIGGLPAAAPDAAEPDAPARITEPVVLLESLSGEVQPMGLKPVTSLAAAGAAFARFENVPRAEAGERIDPGDRATLELIGGDRLGAKVVGGEGDLLAVELEGGPRFDLAIDVVQSLVFPGRIPDTVTESPGPGEDGDRLYLLAGSSLDRAVGYVEAFGPEGVTFADARLGAREYEWDRVVALFVTPFDEEDDDADAEGEDAASAERVSVSLVGGGRLSGELVAIRSALEGVVLRIGTSEVALPGAVVREVTLDDGSYAFLGDLARAADSGASLFGDEIGFRWPVRVDRSCKGDPLRVGGELFDRGLGVHAPSELVWDLEGAGWTELRLACGVDDSGRARSDSTVRGAVRFRVLGDGEVLWESPVHRAGSAALRPMPIALTGVKRLTLEADPAGDFTLDRANWLRPLLVR